MGKCCNRKNGKKLSAHVLCMFEESLNVLIKEDLGTEYHREGKIK